MKKLTVAILVMSSIASVSFAGDKWNNSSSQPVKNYYTGGDKLIDSPEGMDNTNQRQNNYTGGAKNRPSDATRNTQDSPAQYQGKTSNSDSTSNTDSSSLSN